MHIRETSKPRLFPGQRRASFALGWLMLLLSISGQARADRSEQEGLHLRDGDDWAPSLVMDTAVDMRVRGLLAEVRVRQIFRNDTGQWREGRYLLPLPENAAVDTLTVRVGERLIEGQIREKAQARAMYEAAASRGQVASLVEQNRPNLFRTAVANIGPDEEVEIELRYWQPVDYREGIFSLGLPLTLTPRYSPGGACVRCGDAPHSLPSTSTSDTGPLSLPPSISLMALIEPGLPLKNVSSPSHAINVQNQAGGYRVELANLVERSDRDFELRWEPEPSRAPRSAVFTDQVEGEHFALVMLVPPTLPSLPLPRELILVIDNSGSMMGTSMQQAKQAADQALARLRPGDRFNVIRFDHTLESLFSGSVAAEPANVARARMFVRSLQARGGTEMLPAVQLALRADTPPGFLRQVVLATDAAIGNEDELLDLIERERGQSRLFPIGIGSAPNGHFLRKAAELGRGSHVVIRDIHEVSTQMDALLARLDRPAMRDIRIDWPSPAQTYPNRLPDLYLGEALQVVAKLEQPGGQLSVSGLNPQPWVRRVSLDAATAVAAPGVGRLWARGRIEALSDEVRRGGEEPLLRAAIVDTALRHGLVSRYTSLVAIETTPVRPETDALASTQVMNDRPVDGLMLAQGSTGWERNLAWAAALALLALAIGRSRH